MAMSGVFLSFPLAAAGQFNLDDLNQKDMKTIMQQGNDPLNHTILDKNNTKKTVQSENSLKETTPFWLHNPPDSRRCSARSKRTGERCKRFACRDKTVCKFHGGRSTGPKVPAIKHGENALEMIKERLFQRVKTASGEESEAFRYDFAKWVGGRLAIMDYAEFRRVRPAMVAFVRGFLSARRLATVIEGKKRARG